MGFRHKSKQNKKMCRIFVILKELQDVYFYSFVYK
jgi:hypothetical protein